MRFYYSAFAEKRIHRRVSECLSVCLKSLASNTIVDATLLRNWVNTALRSNVTYFRVRRELFASFTHMLDEFPTTPVEIDDELFIVIRQFLTVRNDSINDDKRLAFDKALVDLRIAATRALCPVPHAVPAPFASSGEAD